MNRRKKNVLQFIGSFHLGGSERQAVQLTRLLREDDSTNVAVAALNKQGVLLAEIEKLDLPELAEFKLNSFYDANFIKQAINCAKFLRRNKIEIVQTHDFYTNVFGMAAARLAGVPLKIAAKRETGGVRTRAQEAIEKIAFRQADAIVANSAAVKNYLQSNGVAAGKINVIYNGLDLQRLAPEIADRRTICEEIGLPTGENIKFITLVANLRHAVKNQPMFLRAAAKIAPEFPLAHFVLAGEGERRGELENLAKNLEIADKAHFVGPCARVSELLSISYAGVLTSFNEGFSNAILEYMAAGVPVVATRVGGAAEAVVENETGFLVDSDNDDTLANRLAELLRDEKKAAAFGKKGRETVEGKFSLENQLRKTLELYESF